MSNGSGAESGGIFRRQYGRRTILRGAAAIGVTAPLLGNATGAQAASLPIGPRWIAYGAEPTTTMYVSWSVGSASGSGSLPPAPQVRYGTSTSYGHVKVADHKGQVPMPGSGEPAEHTVYCNALLSGLAPGTTYHYGVSNDGVTWSGDAAFTTAKAGPSNFRFTAFGDQAANANTAGKMVSLAAAQHPAFHLISGDLSYATPMGLKYPDVSGFHPAQWDTYLTMAGPLGAQSIPWQSSVGAHEVEPLGSNGYAGFITRFPHGYDTSSGSPVVYTYTYGTVAIIHLDGNDLSAQETINAGYSGGGQTAWLGRTLAAYRASTAIDFIVVVCNCCLYSTNRNHGSDGGLRDAWGPLFDEYAVDLVISGHVHAYERTHPMRAGRPTRTVAAGGTVKPATDGTTYICAGGGGNGLYKTWYGTTGSGDAGNSTAPKIWRVVNGKSSDVTDTVKDYSAVRRAVWSCVVVDVTAATASGGTTTMRVQTLMPAQSSTAVTSIGYPSVIDSVTISRTSKS